MQFGLAHGGEEMVGGMISKCDQADEKILKNPLRPIRCRIQLAQTAQNQKWKNLFTKPSTTSHFTQNPAPPGLGHRRESSEDGGVRLQTQ